MKTSPRPQWERTFDIFLSLHLHQQYSLKTGLWKRPCRFTMREFRMIMNRACITKIVVLVTASTGGNDTGIHSELLVGLAAGNGLNMSVYIEGNTTTTAELGVVLFGDVDHNDTFQFLDVKKVHDGRGQFYSDLSRSFSLPHSVPLFHSSTCAHTQLTPFSTKSSVVT